jgi:Trypsin-co-occurring domain 2
MFTLRTSCAAACRGRADEDLVNDRETETLVGLGAAIEALREELTAAAASGAHQRLWFRPTSIELTVQAAVTRTGKGNAGIKWWLVELGGERSTNSATTQTLKLVLEPLAFDATGRPCELLITGADDPAPNDREQTLGGRG